MSGTMMPPPGAGAGPPPGMGGPPPGMGGPPPQMGAPPGGGGMPQIPPQVLQMLMQRMQGGGGGPPGMGGPPPMGGPPGAGPGGPPPPQMPPQAPPGGIAPPGVHPQPPPGPNGPQGGQAAQLASQGRMGDSIVAHVTPGEISIPPQVQTPQLIDAIRRAFQHFGININQFTAGAPQVSHNPATGAPELSLWSALLPIAGAAAGSFIPGVGTAAGMAIGGAAGGAAGSALDGGTAAQIALSGLGGAAGGYVGGGGLSGAAGAAGAAAPAVSAPAVEGATTAALPTAAGAGANPYGAALNSEVGPMSSAVQGGAAQVANPGPVTTSPSNWQQAGSALKGGFAAGTGAALGGALAPTPNTTPSSPPGFNAHTTARAPPTVNQANFQGYNPYTAWSGGGGGFNFFRPQ